MDSAQGFNPELRELLVKRRGRGRRPLKPLDSAEGNVPIQHRTGHGGDDIRATAVALRRGAQDGVEQEGAMVLREMLGVGESNLDDNENHVFGGVVELWKRSIYFVHASTPPTHVLCI